MMVSAAHGQTVDSDLAAAFATCAEQFPGKGSTSKIAHLLCRQELRIGRQGNRIDAVEASGKASSDEEFNPELEALYRGMSDLRGQLRKLRKEQREAKAASPPAPAPKAPVAPALQPRIVRPPPVARMPMGPVPYVVTEKPGRWAATTFSIPTVTSRMRYTRLRRATKKWIRGARSARLIVLKGGSPVAIGHPPQGGLPVSFRLIYADLDGDGKEDPDPYKACNPFVVSELYVPWRSGDNIVFVWLQDTGRRVNGHILWGHPVRVNMEVPLRPGWFKSGAQNGNRL